MVVVLLFLSAMFRAIQEHAKWRNSPGWSILYGSWWLRTDHPLNLDGYHIASALHVGLLFIAALLWSWSFCLYNNTTQLCFFDHWEHGGYIL